MLRTEEFGNTPYVGGGAVANSIVCGGSPMVGVAAYLGTIWHWHILIFQQKTKAGYTVEKQVEPIRS